MSVELIQQAVCYMEEHIYDDITYVETAKSVRMSGYDFHRTFRFVTGMTANEYIRNRRLALAAQELQATDLSVTEAAYKYGYRTPESFSKAFSKFHGSTPKQAKQKGAQIRLFNPLVIKITMEGGSMMDYRMEHRERQKFIALVREFPNEVAGDDNDHSIPDFWSECGRKNRVEPMQSLRPEGKRDVYGLCSPMTQRRISGTESALCLTGIPMRKGQHVCWRTVILYGKRSLRIMPCFHALARTVTAWGKHGKNSLKSLYRRRVMYRRMVRTMRFILKTAGTICSASFGFR